MENTQIALFRTNPVQQNLSVDQTGVPNQLAEVNVKIDAVLQKVEELSSQNAQLVEENTALKRRLLALEQTQVAMFSTIQTSWWKNLCGNSWWKSLFGNKMEALVTKDGTYFGQVLNGARSGEGSFTASDGRIYQGTWKDDQIVKGTLTYPDGTKYEGTFVGEGKKCKGLETYPDRTWFKGCFFRETNEKRHGKCWDGSVMLKGFFETCEYDETPRLHGLVKCSFAEEPNFSFKKWWTRGKPDDETVAIIRRHVKDWDADKINSGFISVTR